MLIKYTIGVKKILAPGNKHNENLSKPYVPIFSKTPANITEPAVSQYIKSKRAKKITFNKAKIESERKSKQEIGLINAELNLLKITKYNERVLLGLGVTYNILNSH